MLCFVSRLMHLGPQSRLSALLLAALPSLATALAQDGADPQAPAGEKEAEGTPEERFEKVLEQFEKERSLEAYERMPTIERFSTAPCKKTIDFLAQLYTDEPNQGIRVAVSHALGKIGTLDAIKSLVTVGLPLFLGDLLIDEIGVSLAGPLAPDAEEWLVKNALSPAVRKDPKAVVVLLRALVRLKTQNRLKPLLAELKSTDQADIQLALLTELFARADEPIAAAAAPHLKSRNPAVQVAAYDVVAAGAARRHRSDLVAGLKHPSWEVRVICLDALLQLRDRDFVKHATALLKDRDPRVQVSAVQGLLERGGAEVIEPLYKALDTTTGRPQDDIADALTRLTGKNFGPVSAQWAGWWGNQKGVKREYKAMSADELSKLKDTAQEGVTVVGPTYFGLRILSKRVAFLLDCSESMNDPYKPRNPPPEDDKDRGKTVVKKPGDDKKAAKKPAGPTRLDIAKKELKGALDAFVAGSLVNFFRFNSLFTDFAAEGGGGDRKSLISLNPQSREAARKFIDASKGEGLTNILGVLKLAFEYGDLDTVYLLSDGAPTIGVTDPAELLAAVRKMNRLRKVKINIISFEPGPAEKELLQALADKNYGVYVER
jgi:HEAT repeat protein